jgi:hypothetical protein
MPRYITCINVTSHRDTDCEAREREERIARLLKAVFPGARVDVTTYAEKPLPKARMH